MSCIRMYVRIKELCTGIHNYDHHCVAFILHLLQFIKCYEYIPLDLFALMR